MLKILILTITSVFIFSCQKAPSKSVAEDKNNANQVKPQVIQLRALKVGDVEVVNTTCENYQKIKITTLTSSDSSIRFVENNYINKTVSNRKILAAEKNYILKQGTVETTIDNKPTIVSVGTLSSRINKVNENEFTRVREVKKTDTRKDGLPLDDKGTLRKNTHYIATEEIYDSGSVHEVLKTNVKFYDEDGQLKHENNFGTSGRFLYSEQLDVASTEVYMKRTSKEKLEKSYILNSAASEQEEVVDETYNCVVEIKIN